MNKQKNKCMDRMKRDDFTLSELLMKKTCKNGVSFRRCQFAPCLIFPFFLQLLNCSIVRLFKCFPAPSYFRVPCSSVLTSRVKIRIFTLIELLIVVAMIAITMRSSISVKFIFSYKYLPCITILHLLMFLNLPAIKIPPYVEN